MSFHNSVGGVETHICELMRSQIKANHETMLLTYDSTIAGTLVLKCNDLTVVAIGSKSYLKYIYKSLSFLKLHIISGFVRKIETNFYFREVAKQVENYNPDVVHQHDFISSVVAVLQLSKKYRIVLTNHTGEYLLLNKYYIGRLFLKNILKIYSSIIGPSKELTPYKYNEKSVTIYNAVDLNKFFPANPKPSNIKSYTRNTNDIVFLCPRRWAPTKGVVYLAEAISMRVFPDNYKFLFAGNEGDSYADYADNIYKILSPFENKTVFYLGNLNQADISIAYNISDYSIFPSLYEAVSIAALEAMACGSLVLSTCVGGMPELIDDGVDGILFMPSSSQEIINAINRIVNHVNEKEMRMKMISKVSNFTWECISLQIQAQYHEC